MSDDVAAYVYRRLAAAVIRRAVLDAKRQDERAIEARAWLAGDAGDFLDALDILPERVARWVRELTPPAQLSLEL